MITNIWNEIKNLLNGLIATTTLTAVYNYDIKEINSFPIAKITTMDGVETVLDTFTNQDNLIFKISVIDQNKSVEVMEARMRLLIDNILNELRKKENQTLNNTVCNFWISFVWGWLDLEQPMRVCEITLNCKTTNTI